jgi:hypothetical protein
MNTYRITVSSFLVATMSMCACLLLLDAPAYAQQLAAVNKSQSAGLAQDETSAFQTEPQNKRDGRINRRPLIDFMRRVFSLQQRGELNLDSLFEIFIEGDLDSEGLIQNAGITQKAGDPALTPLALDFVTALNESGTLGFLNQAKRLRLSINSGENNFDISASYEAESKERAVQKARSYDLLLYAGSMARRGRDEELLYKSLRVSSSDREVILNFSMPRETFCALLSKYLSSH